MNAHNDAVGVVEDLYAAFKAHDVERCRTIMHPEIEWNQMPGFPGGGRWRGPDQIFEKVFQPFQDHWTGFRSQIDEIRADGDTVFAIGRYTGTFNATGRSIDAGLVHVFRVRDGLVVRFDQYTDTAMIAQAVATTS